MKKKRIYYVKFYSPGSFFANDWVVEYDDIPDPAKIEWPGNAYSFTVHNRLDVFEGDEVFTGKPEQIGPWYYHPNSKIETLDEVRNNPNATDILIGNMECNQWSHIVWSRWDNYPQPFDPTKHTVLPPK